MPRRHRRDPTYHQPPPRSEAARRSDPPPWALVAGHEVQKVIGDKEYRCPGCDHLIRVGVAHLVVVPTRDPDARRHWHTECWRRELRLIGR